LQVLVGIPEETSERENGKLSNATLMYIHSNGSPLNNIPARPVIEPALEANKERLAPLMGKATKAAMDGDSAAMKQALENAGMVGQNVAQGWFNDPGNGFAPLKPETSRRKRKKGADVDKPLIDTGELQGSITYVIREKG